MQFKSGLKSVSVTAAFALLVGACATGPRDSEGHPRSALDRSIAQCVVSIGIGALVGALVGAAANRRNGAGTGAAIGAGAGAVYCAILIAVNNEEDRARIRQSEQAAYSSGQSATMQYTGQDGSVRVIRTSVQTVATPAQPATTTADAGETIVGPCRKAQTTISVGGKGSVALDPEIVCRTALGDYVPLNGKPTT